MDIGGNGRNSIPPIEEKLEPFADLTRCHLYSPGGGIPVESHKSGHGVELAVNFKTRSLPWKRPDDGQDQDQDVDEEENSLANGPVENTNTKVDDDLMF